MKTETVLLLGVLVAAGGFAFYAMQGAKGASSSALPQKGTSLGFNFTNFANR